MHPEYPDLLHAALLSDAYWTMSMDEDAVTHNQEGELVALNNRMKRLVDREESMPGDMKRVLLSAQDGMRVADPLEVGDVIPDLHSRQIVLAVEDSRQLIRKMSLRAITLRLANRRLVAPLERQLSSFYSEVNPIPATLSIDKYNAVEIAALSRARLIMKKDEQGRLLAMDMQSFMSGAGMLRRLVWQMPQELVVGRTYSKNPHGLLDHMGKIISAQVVEALDVDWSVSDEDETVLRSVPAD